MPAGALHLPTPSFTPTSRERVRLGVRQSLRPSEWAERYRWVTEGPLAMSGAIRWRNETFPPGVDIMDAAGSGRWRRVLCMAAPQSSGKTAHFANVLLWALHWRNQDALYMHANAAKGEAQFAKKMAPAIARCPQMAHLIPAAREDRGTKEAHKFTNGCQLVVTGSESEADLSGPTLPVLFADDVHAMPPRLGAHGHPVEFAEKRQAAFPLRDRVTMIAGQASDVESWLYLQLVASTFYVLHVPCLGCGWYQMIDWRRMVYDGSSVDAARRDCCMKCANDACTHAIRHEELREMLARYAWVSTPAGRNPLLNPNDRVGLPSLEGQAVYPESARSTQQAGFWWNAFSYPLVTWAEHAADCVQAKAVPDGERTFAQQSEVIPATPELEDVDGLRPDDVRAHYFAEHRWKTVPADSGVGAADDDGVLILSADVMGGWIWYLACAWRKRDGAGWLVECKRLGAIAEDAAKYASQREREQAWGAQVDKHLSRLWERNTEGWPIVSLDGEVLAQAKADLITVDTKYLGGTVQTFCRLRNSGDVFGVWRPVAGSTRSARDIDTPLWPAQDRPVRGKKIRWHRMWLLNVNRAKYVLLDILAIPPGAPGYFALPHDMDPWTRDQFEQQLCAEQPNQPRGTWLLRSRNNHLLDLMAHQVCAATKLGVRFAGIDSNSDSAPGDAPDTRSIAERRIDRRASSADPGSEAPRSWADRITQSPV